MSSGNTPLDWRLADAADLPVLTDHIADFYREDQIPLNHERVQAGLQQLLAAPANGAVLILSTAQEPFAGYITLGWCFSVEQGGRFVLLDELYLGPAARGRGWGRQALALARDWAAGQGAAVIRLEVNHHNAKAKSLYLSAGYRDDERDILTLSLNGASGRLHS